MAEDKAAKAGILLGGAALAAAAVALATEKVKASSEEGGTLTLDTVTMNLLIAIAQTSADTQLLLAKMVGSIESGEAAIQVQGYPPNTEAIIATRVAIAALGIPYQLPDIVVPDDMNLQLKGWPTNGGLILVGNSRATCLNVNSSWPLLANEAIGYRVKNAKELYISGTGLGDFCVMTVEQRR